MKQKILALCGGVGGAKLAYGLSQLTTSEEIVFLVNTGDDFYTFRFKHITRLGYRYVHISWCK